VVFPIAASRLGGGVAHVPLGRNIICAVLSCPVSMVCEEESGLGDASGAFCGKDASPAGSRCPPKTSAMVLIGCMNVFPKKENRSK